YDKISNDSRVKIKIAEVMTTQVIMLHLDHTALDAAKLMRDKNVGSIILKPKKGKANPIGIVTERDIVTRVVAKGKDPEKVQLRTIASKPVVTVPPEMEITEGMSLLGRLNIRRLVVVDKEKNVLGICTYRDLLKVAPSLIEIALEYEKIGFKDSYKDQEEQFTADDEYNEDSELNPKELSLGYYCSQCGDWSVKSPADYLDDEPVCDECIQDVDSDR
ncbi:MAG: CBS domain-containing protein, partial [Candidatus Heimdallarchaeota archaeon]